MRAVVQRVSSAKVTVEGQTIGQIERGLCVLIGVASSDQERDADALAEKIAGLRIFEDEAGKMNLSVADVGGAILAVSQFTLLGDARKGKRPSFTLAMEPSRANQLFSLVCERLKALGLPVATGRFRAQMQVALVNEGPVTLLLDTQRTF